MRPSFGHKIDDALRDAEMSFFFEDEDSLLPHISFDVKTGKVRGIMFKSGSDKVFLNNESGHTAYRTYENGESYSWQLSRREFKRAVNHVINLVDDCDSEVRDFYFEALSGLDYCEGKKNAHFDVIVLNGKVKNLRFDWKNIYYTLNPHDGVVLKGNVDDPFSHLNKEEVHGIEKCFVKTLLYTSPVIKRKLENVVNE